MLTAWGLRDGALVYGLSAAARGSDCTGPPARQLDSKGNKPSYFQQSKGTQMERKARGQRVVIRHAPQPGSTQVIQVQLSSLKGMEINDHDCMNTTQPYQLHLKRSKPADARNIHTVHLFFCIFCKGAISVLSL